MKNQGTTKTRTISDYMKSLKTPSKFRWDVTQESWKLSVNYQNLCHKVHETILEERGIYLRITLLL